MNKTNIAFCAVVTNVVASSRLRHDFGLTWYGLLMAGTMQS